MPVDIPLRVALAATVATMTLSATAAVGKEWTCKIYGLKDSRYSGGLTAYIHMKGLTSGRYYAVRRRGDVARGKTDNGNEFICRAK